MFCIPVHTKTSFINLSDVDNLVIYWNICLCIGSRGFTYKAGFDTKSTKDSDPRRIGREDCVDTKPQGLSVKIDRRCKIFASQFHFNHRSIIVH